jgi:hypothetical protein
VEYSATAAKLRSTVQRNCRGHQHIEEYSGTAEDSNIFRSTATYSEKDSGIEKDRAFAESSYFSRTRHSEESIAEDSGFCGGQESEDRSVSGGSLRPKI